MNKQRLISKKGEGTFSEVLKAQSVKTGKQVAIKCMKNHFDSIDQVNNLREIQALRRLSPNNYIIKLLEVLYDEPTGRLALVFDLMDMNLYESIRGRRHQLPEQRCKHLMWQLLRALDHMHRNGIFHRDVKPENMLLEGDVLRLADFGSCRGIQSKPPYTEYISTRWYRAPECLLTDGYYNYKMDLWSVGCVFFEIMSLFPLFPGTNELDQINKIHNIMGTPDMKILMKFKKQASHMDFNFQHKEGTGIDKLIPHATEECRDLIKKFLIQNPEERINARQALKHSQFKDQQNNENKVDNQSSPRENISTLPAKKKSLLPDIKYVTLDGSTNEKLQNNSDNDDTQNDQNHLPPIKNYLNNNKNIKKINKFIDIKNKSLQQNLSTQSLSSVKNKDKSGSQISPYSQKMIQK